MSHASLRMDTEWRVVDWHVQRWVHELSRSISQKVSQQGRKRAFNRRETNLMRSRRGEPTAPTWHHTPSAMADSAV